ncbi:hypothetical protein ONS95_010837 [Cadophora gregata]|uniref:uncharacterized protein n=1 Tax=Cadophora gregata TaxID=51156 RepID=UPI0026DB7FF0|nr:uncharacterized protein ONS95_010837 [Cadophora gregata]KAK0119385.1 hypothetical protein ONS95_010837 [Cadophora gregata]KAK0120418.1 hypothetical protein ONS96_010634 [Cadophora gregata f. sp. sojae]
MAEHTPHPATDTSSSRTSDISMLRPSSTGPENPFTFEGGDICITVNFHGEEMKGKVISGSMASASQVWKRFLFPPWCKEEDGPVKELDFKEDDGEALLTLLRIVHFQFAKIPTSFEASIKPLYDIAVLCEQYDCVSIVKPWTERWCVSLHDKSLPLFASDTRRKVYIAWAFGMADNFRHTAKTILEKCTAQEKGTLQDDEAILPEKLLESIQSIRENTLTQLLDIPYQHLQRCTKTSPCGDKRCNPLIYGSLLLELGRRGLWPKKTPEEIKDSVTTIADLIRDIEVLYPREHPADLELMSSEEKTHSPCRVNYSNKVCRVMAAMPNPTLDCHLRHMQLRSGIATVKELTAAPCSPGSSSSFSEPEKKRPMVVISPTSSPANARGSSARQNGSRWSSLSSAGSRAPPSTSTSLGFSLNRRACRLCGKQHLSSFGCDGTPVRGTKRPLPY